MNQIIFWVPPLHWTNTFQHWQLNQCYAMAVVQLTIGFICLPIIRDAGGGFAVKSYQRSFCLVSTIASIIFCHGATILSKSFHTFCKLLQASRWTVMCVVLLQLASTGPHFRFPLDLDLFWKCLWMKNLKILHLTCGRSITCLDMASWIFQGCRDRTSPPARDYETINKQLHCSICIVTRAVAQNLVDKLVL